MGLVVVFCVSRQAQRVQLRTELRANPRLIPGLVGRRDEILSNHCQPSREHLDHRARGVAGERARDVEVHADVVTASAHHPPFIAEKTEPLDRLQRGRRPCQRTGGIWRVLGEVVAAAVGVGEHGVTFCLAAAVQLDGLLRTLDHLTSWLARRGLETRGQRPRLFFSRTAQARQ